MSLFQPLTFDPQAGADLLSDPAQAVEQSRWWGFEGVHRRALVDAPFRHELHVSRDQLEKQLLELCQLASPDWLLMQQLAQAWHQHWQQRAAAEPAALNRWWRRHARL
jgi:dipeptidase